MVGPSEKIIVIIFKLGYFIHPSDLSNIHAKNNSHDLILKINHSHVLVIQYCNKKKHMMESQKGENNRVALKKIVTALS